MTEVLLERPAEGVALLRINRPQARNAINAAVRTGLAAHLQAFAADEAVRAVVIAGSDTVFAAGSDIRDMAEAGAVDIMLRNAQAFWQVVAEFPKPLLAAVNGYALGGGCELAMHADIIIAGEGAHFGQPEVRIGIMPGAGGTQRLFRAVGKYKAMKIVLAGEFFTAAEADSMGLVSEVVADAQVLERALELAGRIAAMPPLAVRQIKEVALAGADAPLATGLALERKAFQLLFASEDQKEGMRAFLDKRKPAFRGR